MTIRAGIMTPRHSPACYKVHISRVSVVVGTRELFGPTGLMPNVASVCRLRFLLFNSFSRRNGGLSVGSPLICQGYGAVLVVLLILLVNPQPGRNGGIFAGAAMICQGYGVVLMAFLRTYSLSIRGIVRWHHFAMWQLGTSGHTHSTQDVFKTTFSWRPKRQLRRRP